MIPLDKVAVCLTCGNEWEVRTAGVGKKRKCPVCGKYRVKMKSEIKKEEKAAGAPPPAEDPPAAAAAPPADPPAGEQEENSSGEKEEENSGGGFITYAALLLLAVGAGWFLVGLVRRRRAAPVDKSAEVGRINQRVRRFRGFEAVLWFLVCLTG